MHVLPDGFQKIRYYGFLNNRYKSKNLKLIFTLQGHQRFHVRYTGLSMAELLKAVWKVDICICPECGCQRMQHIGKTYGTSWPATVSAKYFFNKPPEEGFKSMPFFKNGFQVIMIIIRNTCIPASIYDNFTRWKEYFPHIHPGYQSAAWYNFEESHLEQFCFCSELLFSDCSEYDTSLKNYSKKTGNSQFFRLQTSMDYITQGDFPVLFHEGHPIQFSQSHTMLSHSFRRFPPMYAVS